MDSANPFQVIEEDCCSPATDISTSLHDDLKTLLSDYDIKAAAASVKVYAVKPVAVDSTSCCGPTCCSQSA
jgi:hypothetical protein